MAKKQKKHVDTQNKEYKNYIHQKIEEFNTNGKKTIVQFCDTYYPIIDGVIKVLDNYATLCSKDYNIVVVVPKHKNKEIVTNKNYLVIGVASMYFKFVNYDLAFPNVDNFFKICIKKLRIDLIHSHSPFNMGSYAYKIAKKLKVPFVMTMHSQYKLDFLKYTKNEAISNMLTKNIIKVFNNATEVWTMHTKASDALKSYGYKSSGKFCYIPNATDYEPPKSPEILRQKINKKYKLEDTDNVFLFVGRLVNQKNIQFIVDALKALDDKKINFKMFFVGSGPDEEELKEHIQECKLNKKVILTGSISSREELSAYYQRADLFLFPSIYDTSSIVQIEAATFKTPGVFIEDTVTACTIKDRHNGYLSKENINDFADTIIEAISNKEELKRISENAFNEVYISWDQVAEQVKARYEYLIERNNKKLKKLNAIKQQKKEIKK